MSSKLTLRIDDEVKDAAKTLAKRRGESVSQMVEDYFRLLLESEADAGPDPAGSMDAQDEEPASEINELGPITRGIAGALQSAEAESEAAPLHGTTKEDDRHVAAKAAAKKHAGE